jgi:alpha-glucuronidase
MDQELEYPRKAPFEETEAHATTKGMLDSAVQSKVYTNKRANELARELTQSKAEHTRQIGTMQIQHAQQWRDSINKNLLLQVTIEDMEKEKKGQAE